MRLSSAESTGPSYCLPAHLGILGRMGMDKSLGRRLSIDYKSATLDPKVAELLKFCEKLTNHPGDMQRADIENLRKSGLERCCHFRRCPDYVALRLRQPVLGGPWPHSRLD